MGSKAIGLSVLLRLLTFSEGVPGRREIETSRNTPWIPTDGNLWEVSHTKECWYRAQGILGALDI